MNDTLYDKVKEKVNQYNTLLTEYGVKITLQHRSYKEEVEAYNHYGIGCNNLWNLLEYILFKKGIEEKKYHYTPNQYKLLVLAVEPTKKSKANKKDYKKYAFLVYSMSRGFQGEKPIEYQSKEQKIIKKIEKRLEKLLKKAER